MKIIRIVALVVFIGMMSTYSFAISGDNIHEYEAVNITVIFQENTAFSHEKQSYIADNIIYGSDNVMTTYSLCWLTGHDTTSEIVTSVKHKVSSSSPRCFQTLYRVTTCSNCDYADISEISSTYIYCCPEEGTSTVQEG